MKLTRWTRAGSLVAVLGACDHAPRAPRVSNGAPVAQPAPSTPTLPSFDAYPVPGSFAGRPARVDLTSDPGAREFRTVLRDGAAAGPNFAGHYTVVTWGCGSSCQVSAVVDARSGRVYGDWIQTSAGLAYRRASALLIADPPDSARAAVGGGSPDPCLACGTPAAYVWRGDRFEPVGPGAHPHLLSASDRLRHIWRR